jgi:hypothetical protein
MYLISGADQFQSTSMVLKALLTRKSFELKKMVLTQKLMKNLNFKVLEFNRNQPSESLYFHTRRVFEDDKNAAEEVAEKKATCRSQLKRLLMKAEAKSGVNHSGRYLGSGSN